MTTFLPDFTGRMSDQRARHYYEKLIMMKGLAEAGDTMTQRDAMMAARMHSELARGLLSPVIRKLGLLVSREEYVGLPDQERRALINRALAVNLPILQQEARYELFTALEGLDAGHAAPLVQNKGGLRRAKPNILAKVELDILKWTRWQHGRGRKIGDAESEASEAVGCSRDAVRKWPAKLSKVFGEKRVRSELKLAEEVGRHEAKGLDHRDIQPGASDESQMLLDAIVNLRRDLRLLAEVRLECMAKRTIPKNSAE